LAIAIRKPSEIEEIKKAGKIVGATLKLLRENAKPGVTPLELDKMAEDFIRSQNARPAFKGLYDFPMLFVFQKMVLLFMEFPIMNL
jgi:methionyl aminopeptidase